MPLLRVLVLAFALVHATGLSDALEAACADGCVEEDCEDGCPPMCPTCHCVRCPTATAVTGDALDGGRPPPVSAATVDTERVPSSPDPGEILRVPKTLLV